MNLIKQEFKELQQFINADGPIIYNHNNHFTDTYGNQYTIDGLVKIAQQYYYNEDMTRFNLQTRINRNPHRVNYAMFHPIEANVQLLKHNKTSQPKPKKPHHNLQKLLKQAHQNNVNISLNTLKDRLYRLKYSEQEAITIPARTSRKIWRQQQEAKNHG